MVSSRSAEVAQDGTSVVQFGRVPAWAGALALAAAMLGLTPGEAEAYCRMSTARSAVDSCISPCAGCVDFDVEGAADKPDCTGPDCDLRARCLEWRRRCVSFSVDARGSKDIDLDTLTEIMQRSAGTWMSVECEGQALELQVRQTREHSLCDRAEYNTEEGNVNTVTFVNDWLERDYTPAAYALTTVWHHRRTGEIFDADMEINEQRGTYGICPEGGCSDGTIDLENVTTHEMGHFVGLAHTADSSATMFCMSPPGEVQKRTLATDDVEGLCDIYPPGSLSEQCDFTPRHGLALDCESDEGCGCSAPGAGRSQSAPWVMLILGAGLLWWRRRGR